MALTKTRINSFSVGFVLSAILIIFSSSVFDISSESIIPLSFALSPITFDNSNSTLCSAASCPVSLDVAPGSDRVIIVAVADETSPNPVLSADINGDTAKAVYLGISQVGSGSTTQNVELWMFLEADIIDGTNNITVNFGSSVTGAGITVVSFSNVKQQLPEAQASSSVTSSTTITVGVTSLTDGAVIISLVGNGQTGNLYASHGAGQNEVSNFATTSAATAVTYEIKETAGADTQSHVTSSTSNRQAVLVIVLAPAAVGPDITPPVITLNGANPQTIVVGSGYTELGATTDDGSPITIDASAFVDAVGSYPVTYDSVDSSGNNAIQVTRTVNVVVADTTPPVITLNGANPQTIVVGSGYTELGATTDDGSPITIDASAFVDAVGSYPVTYDSVDSSGNNAIQVTRTVNVVVENLDVFGITKIYPTKPGGNTWFMDMTNPTSDPRFDPQGTITQNPDGSWKIQQDQVRMVVYSTDKTTYENTPIPTFSRTELDTKGYMQLPSDWKNFEMTGYVKLNVDSNDEFTWYGRGGSHNDANSGCEGSSVKAWLGFDGTTQFAKESWHVHYDLTIPKSSTPPLLDNWIGYKFVVYNKPGVNFAQQVHQEIWVDVNNNNTWVKVHSFDDDGFGSGANHCGPAIADNMPITWGGPIATFRTDNADDFDFKYLSVREIEKVIPNSYDGTKAGVMLTFEHAEDNQLTEIDANMPDMLGTMSPISDRVGTSGYITQQEMLDLQDRGFEISSHSKSHETISSSTSTSVLIEELVQSKQDLEAMGFQINGYVWPYNNVTEEAFDIVKENYLWTTFYSPISGYPDYMTISSMEDSFQDHGVYHQYSHGVGNGYSLNTLSEVKDEIDYAIANNFLIGFKFHGIHTGGGGTVTSPTMFEDIIDYLREQRDLGNLDVLTRTQGLGSLVQDYNEPITTASPGGGPYTSPQLVTLEANEVSTIYYTLDGTLPTTLSTKYTTPISIFADTTLKFFAVDTSGNIEAVNTAGYFFYDPIDIFGITKIYPPKPWGNNWYMDMANPTSDPRFDPQGTITQNPDGSWKMQQSQVRMNVFSTDKTTYENTPIPTFSRTELDAKGYMQLPSDWKNFEITGYVKLNEGSGNGFIWYGRGGSHNLSNSGCEGSSTKGQLNNDGETRFAKESWHVNYDFTDYKPNIPSLFDKWTGFKFMVYNQPGVNFAQQVHQEIWVDVDSTNNWVMIDSFVDDGFGSGANHCGPALADNMPISWGGPKATFRTDDNPDFDFKFLSVREIQASSTPTTVAFPAGGIYSSTQLVTLTTNKVATIYYTLDGSEPTTSSFIYSSPISISSSKTLKFFAVDLDGNVESVKTETYTISSLGSSEIIFDNSNSTLCSAASCPVSLDVAPGSDRVIIVAVEDEGTSSVASADINAGTSQAVYLGNAQVGSGSTTQNVELWMFLETDIIDGTNSITVNFGSSVTGAGITVVSFSNVKQQLPEAQASSSVTSSTTITVGVTSITDGAVIISLVGNGQSGNLYSSHGAGQNEVSNFATTSAATAVTYEIKETAGADTQSHVTSSTSNRQAVLVIVLAPAVLSDTTPPVITLLGPNPQTIDQGNGYTELNATTDDGSPITIDATAFVDAVGSYPVTYDSVDVAGNNAVQVTRTVNVVPDTTPPVITLLGPNPQTIEQGNGYTELNATTDDGLPITIDASAFVDTLGSYPVTYDSVDSSGNAAITVTRTVNVVDTTPPVITLLGANPQIIVVGSGYTELNATTDDGSPITIDASAFVDAVGSYPVTYDSVDASGNNAIQVTRTVNVVDTTPPVITLLGANPQTIEKGTGYTELGATTDDGSPITIDASAFVDAVGSYAVTYDATDASGNPAVQVTRTVNVVDTTPPVITLLGANPQTIVVGSGYTELNATTDDGSPITIDASAFVDAVGSYPVTYDSVDASGNNAIQVTRTVNVIPDTTPPVITLLGPNPQSINLGDGYTELNATTDDGSPITIDASAFVDAVGSYPVTYDSVDASGNNAIQVTRTVNVVDTPSEIIFDNSNSTLCSAASCPISLDVAPGSDRVIIVAVADETSPNPVLSADINAGTSQGVYLGISQVGSGSTTQNVELWMFLEADIIDGTNNITVNFGSSVTGAGITVVSFSNVKQQLPEAQASGSVTSSTTITVGVTSLTDGAVILSLVGNGASGNLYSSHGAGQNEVSNFATTSAATAVTYEIKETAGADTQSHVTSSTSNRQAVLVIVLAPAVIVPDNTPPIITLLGANPQTIVVGSGYTELGANTDDGSPITIDASAFVDAVGSYPVTYDSVDASGNNAIQVTRTVNVIPDTTPPVITLLGPNPQSINLGDGYTELNATTDDGSPITIDASAFVDAVGSYPVTYDSVDAAGNNAVQVTRTVNVVDAPSEIIFDNSNSTLCSAASCPISLDVAPGSDRVIVLAVADETSPNPVLSADINGNTAKAVYLGISQVGSGSTTQNVELWMFLETDIIDGTNNITVNFGSSVTGAGITVVSFSNVKQQLPEAQASSSVTSSTTITVGVTSITDGAVIISLVGNGQTGNLYASHGAGQNEVSNFATTSAATAVTYEIKETAGADTQSHVTSSTSNRQAVLVIVLAPAN